VRGKYTTKLKKNELGFRKRKKSCLGKRRKKKSKKRRFAAAKEPEWRPPPKKTPTKRKQSRRRECATQRGGFSVRKAAGWEETAGEETLQQAFGKKEVPIFWSPWSAKRAEILEGKNC